MWTRRRVLVAALAGAAGSAGLYAAGRSSDPTGVFADPDDAARFGEAYLAALPEHERPDLDGLLTALFGSPEDARRTLSAGPAEVGAWLRSAQVKDFEAGRLADVAGWLLSETEARLCAVIARA